MQGKWAAEVYEEPGGGQGSQSRLGGQGELPPSQQEELSPAGSYGAANCPFLSIDLA